MAFDLHVFINRNGDPCVSVTTDEHVRSKPIAINTMMARTLLKAALDARSAVRVMRS